MGLEFAQWGEQFTIWFGSLFGAHAATAIAVLKIIGINIVLSGDNAVVIAMACRGLPPEKRKMGIMLGAGAAVVLRIIFTVFIVYLLDVPWLKLAGGLLLLWIAIKLLTGDDHGEDVEAGSSLWEAVKIVAIADIVMSLDNVLAIAGAAESAPADQRLDADHPGSRHLDPAGRGGFEPDHRSADALPDPGLGGRRVAGHDRG